MPKRASELGQKRDPGPRTRAELLARTTSRRHLLKEKDVVGCMVFYQGDMVMFRNGFDNGDGCVNDNGDGVPADKPLYPVVDLLGNVEEVRAPGILILERPVATLRTRASRDYPRYSVADEGLEYDASAFRSEDTFRCSMD